MGAFGEKFRKEREKKNFSLDDVSAVTKIGTRMLRAIEEEHFDQLPGGVFNKGFIRTYAKHLGMNDEKAVADYLACVRKTQIDAHEDWQPARPAQNQAASKKTVSKKKGDSPAPKTQTPVEVEELPELQLPRAEHVRPPRNKYLEPRDGGIPWRLLAAAVILIVLAAILWHRHSRGPRTEAVSASEKPVLSVPSTPAPMLTPAGQTSSPHSANAAGSHSSGPTGQPAASPQAATVLRSSSPTRSPANPVADAAQNNAVQNSGASAAQAADQALPAAPLTLIIRASENSWISVLADGQAVSEETLIAPAHTSVRASREIVVKTGNAAGVSFLWNGKEVPAQGAEAEVRTFVFDSAGMRTTTPTQPAQN